ncbi:MAG: acyl-CoA dehydrogenase family protein [Frankiaceae bacterium]|nr:acyl-CoA dehydrogenase family protein [Frankiaceae bacterium]MBV9869964.1 acyl-CoA dehydrogenase family protein [Frankiaceae bacterium]
MIGWSDTELAIQEAIREFADKEIRPHADALEDGEMLPYPIIRKLFSTFGVDAMALDNFKQTMEKERAAAAGDAPVEKPKSLTAGANNEAMTLILSMELCKVNMGLTSAMGVSVGLSAGTIMSRGTIEQKERWVPDLLTFDKVGAWAITEPNSGSDAFGGMTTTVRRQGDGYVLNGEKTFITNGPYADTTVVYAKLDDGSGVDKRKRPVLTFVLDAGMPGFTQSKPLKKMGIHASPTGQLFFSDVYLEPDRLLGDPSGAAAQDGRESARANFVTERVGIAAMSLGVIEECLRLCVDYAKKRELWGQRIGDFQLIQLKLANMEVARLNVEGMVFRALELRRAGKSPTLAEASAMKYYASQAATEVAMEAVQLFGGNGYMSEYRVEQLARDAKSLMIYAGSNEVQITHIAKDLLA